MSAREFPDPLVQTDWLGDRLDDPSIHVVEVDENPDAYLDPGHIPGATLWDWVHDLHHPIRRDYVGGDALTALLTRSGVSEGDRVILYGGNSNWFAAYALWLLELVYETT